ncbi:MAG: radical SAM protein [Treponemataceae bacterium]
MNDLKTYFNCNICPRQCGANRNDGNTGFCQQTAKLKIAVACIHFGEEPPISVLNGSGTIFITGCNLGCSFCQNYQISQKNMGKEISTEEFARICILLQESFAENINIVTGSHVIPALSEGLKKAKKLGLKIPVCWNSSGYESIEALEMLEDLVDIWLPDMKTLNSVISAEVFSAKDYPSVTKKSIKWMINHAPLKFETVKTIQDKKTIKRFGGNKIEKMTSGVIIRHLVLPGRLDDTRMVLDWLKIHADDRACISLMSQYTPVKFSPQEAKKRESSLKSFQHRLMNDSEFCQIQKMISEYDFSHLFYQELSQDTDWLPDFEKQQPFSNELSKTLWHWKS